MSSVFKLNQPNNSFMSKRVKINSIGNTSLQTPVLLVAAPHMVSKKVSRIILVSLSSLKTPHLSRSTLALCKSHS